jgi:hypothetical protein
MNAIFTISDSVITSPKIASQDAKQPRPQSNESPNQGQEEGTGLKAFLSSVMFEKVDELQQQLIDNAPVAMNSPASGLGIVDPQSILFSGIYPEGLMRESANMPSLVPRPRCRRESLLKTNGTYQRATSRRRNSHLESEKRRRVNMRDSYERLAQRIPEEFVEATSGKQSKASVLRSSYAYLQFLVQECEELEEVNRQTIRRYSA